LFSAVTDDRRCRRVFITALLVVFIWMFFFPLVISHKPAELAIQPAISLLLHLKLNGGFFSKYHSHVQYLLPSAPECPPIRALTKTSPHFLYEGNACAADVAISSAATLARSSFFILALAIVMCVFSPTLPMALTLVLGPV
jgi:hypothetical protein